jgi:hypothetical protein
MLRSPRRPLRVGDVVEIRGFSAQITALMPDGRPAEAIVRFEIPLEDPSLRWFAWAAAGFEPFRLPEVGKQVVLPKVDLMKVAYGDD